MPFCGSINQKCCQAIRLNHGLYTQCLNTPSDYTSQYPLCSTCSKQTLKDSGMPKYGYIIDRVSQGTNYRDPLGKAPVNYGNIMEKLKIEKYEAIELAESLGLTIPEDQFNIKKGQRGRPKKDTVVCDTESEASEIVVPKPQKKRGRPPKQKDIISNTLEKNMLEEIINTADKKSDNVVSDSSSDKESNLCDEDPDIQAFPIILDKTNQHGYKIQDDLNEATEYLICCDNNYLYDPTTHEQIGYWNIEKKCVVKVSD